MRNTILSREQQADLDFLLHSLPFRTSFKYDDEAGLNEFVEGLLNSVSFFGVSELEFRKRDRCRSKLSVGSLKDVYSRNGIRNNSSGIRSLTIAAAELKQFASTVKFNKKNVFVPGEFRNDLISFFEDLEIKPTDVDKLIKVLDETLAECSKGPEQTLAYLQRKTDELSKLRNSPDRGAVDNIPWWKLVAIAIYIGLAIWDIWRCIIRNRCSTAEKVVIKVGHTIASLIMKFC